MQFEKLRLHEAEKHGGDGGDNADCHGVLGPFSNHVPLLLVLHHRQGSPFPTWKSGPKISSLAIDILDSLKIGGKDREPREKYNWNLAPRIGNILFWRQQRAWVAFAARACGTKLCRCWFLVQMASGDNE